MDPYKAYLFTRWNEGCRNAAQLFREIQSRGYAGEATTVREHVRALHQAGGTPSGNRTQRGEHVEMDPTKRTPTLRALVWCLLRPPEDRKDEHEQILGRISRGQDILEKTVSLARSFAAMIRERQEDQLDEWLKRAQSSSNHFWCNFAAGLEQDLDAVRAALTQKWSNGPTEGFINRLKCPKRQLYGRAKVDLLRKRLLWQDQWSFT
ncbi:MAG: transposase [Deltaproteobacteria bacterium]|nr:transposase [Deltaproteobacteria bacterium]